MRRRLPMPFIGELPPILLSKIGLSAILARAISSVQPRLPCSCQQPFAWKPWQFLPSWHQVSFEVEASITGSVNTTYHPSSRCRCSSSCLQCSTSHSDARKLLLARFQNRSNDKWLACCACIGMSKISILLLALHLPKLFAAHTQK